MHNTLYVARRENRLRQKDMAELLHINPITYQLKESGKAAFTLPEAFTISERLGMTIEELFDKGQAQ